MEVHAHAHTERKKWTHYLWEFVMLFLAVFCGSLAENQREHMLEKKREKEYMESMVKDLQTDTAACSRAFQLAAQQSDLQDSLIHLINFGKPDGANIQKLYLLAYSTTRIIHAAFETRTAVQLKNSGSMRLIGNSIVADSIRAYWTTQETADKISDRIENEGVDVRNVAARIFNNKYVILSDLRIGASPTILPGATFIHNDPALFAEYSNKVFTKRRIVNNYMIFMTRASEEATRLIGQIRKEYHISE